MARSIESAKGNATVITNNPFFTNTYTGTSPSGDITA